jgi:hypothetical protein
LPTHRIHPTCRPKSNTSTRAMLRDLEDRAHASGEKMTRVVDPTYDAIFKRLEEICAKSVSHASEAVIAYGLQELLAEFGSLQVCSISSQIRTWRELYMGFSHFLLIRCECVCRC